MRVNKICHQENSKNCLKSCSPYQVQLLLLQVYKFQPYQFVFLESNHTKYLCLLYRLFTEGILEYFVRDLKKGKLSSSQAKIQNKLCLLTRILIGQYIIIQCFNCRQFMSNKTYKKCDNLVYKFP